MSLPSCFLKKLEFDLYNLTLPQPAYWHIVQLFVLDYTLSWQGLVHLVFLIDSQVIKNA